MSSQMLTYFVNWQNAFQNDTEGLYWCDFKISNPSTFHINICKKSEAFFWILQFGITRSNANKTKYIVVIWNKELISCGIIVMAKKISLDYSEKALQVTFKLKKWDIYGRFKSYSSL